MACTISVLCKLVFISFMYIIANVEITHTFLQHGQNTGLENGSPESIGINGDLNAKSPDIANSAVQTNRFETSAETHVQQNDASSSNFGINNDINNINFQKNRSQNNNFQRTQIFIRAVTLPGQYIFIRGGISTHIGRECTDNATTDPCAIPIHHRIVPSDPNSAYRQLAAGDVFLDWYGQEDGQAGYNGSIPSEGTPLMWSTSDNSLSEGVVEEDGYGYTPYNRFGEHYWFVDLDMDCDATEGGWFEFKTYRTVGGWEDHITQYTRCGGQIDQSGSYPAVNHLGMCGQMNVFFEHQDECSIYHIPEQMDELPDACGKSKMFEDVSFETADPYIVGGSPASLGRWPWQAALQYDDVIGGCGAVVIDNHWALTAAHCVWNTWPAILHVRTAEQNLAVEQGHEQSVQVLRIHIHDCYRSDTCGDVPYNDYDLAILELADAVSLDDYVTNTICLPYDYSLDDFVGDNCVATGFGDTKGTGFSYRLHQVLVPVHSHEDCVAWWGEDSITVRQMCMGTADTSACGGDSGSPLVCWRDDKWVLAGVTSWGSQDCEGNHSVYSRISEFMDWIREVTGLRSCHNSKSGKHN